MDYEQKIKALAQDITNYYNEVHNEQFNYDFEDTAEAVNIILNDIDQQIDSVIKDFEYELTHTQPDVQSEWSNFYSCKSPVEILDGLKEIKKLQPEKEYDNTKSLNGKAKDLQLLDTACTYLNDEDLQDIWLAYGCPDGSTEDDYVEMAEDAYDDIMAVGVKLLKMAVKDESHLYNCPEDAYKYAKSLVSGIKNLKYVDGNIVEEDYSQVGAIAGPTGMFGVKHKEKKEETNNIIDDKVQMEIYELIQNGRRLDKQDIETNIQATIEAIKEEYPELDVSEYVRRKALEIYNGDYDNTDLPTDEIYELLSNGMFAGEDIKDNINSTVKEIMNDYGTDYKEEDIRNYVEQKAQEIYANELDESKIIEDNIIKYKGFIIDIEEVNTENEDETIVQIYKSQKDYDNGDYLERVSLYNRENLEQEIKNYIDNNVLAENKKLKTESKTLEDIQMEIYEMLQNGRKLDKQDKITNIKETIKAIKLDYPNINEKDLTNYVQRKADEIYAGEYDEIKTESKKTEAKLEDIQMEIYEMIQNGRRLDNQDMKDNIKNTVDAIKQDYPEINEKELIAYVTKKADEIYAGEYDENKTRKTEKELTEKYKIILHCYDIDQVYDDEITRTFDNKQDAIKEMKIAAIDELHGLQEDISDKDFVNQYRLSTDGDKIVIYKGNDKLTEYEVVSINTTPKAESLSSKKLKTEGLYNHCYNTSDREELKEIALNALYIADNDNLIIKELKDRLTAEEKKEWRDDFIGICQHPYDYIANNYYSMPLELLREIALDAVYVANDDEAIQKEIDDRKI